MAAPDEKPRRRLPVIGGAPPAPDDAARPRWHWSVIVGLGTLFGWLLLEMVAAGPIAEPIAAGGRATLAAAVHLVALALPAGGAGALAGRVARRARMVDAVLGAVGLIVLVAGLAWWRVGGSALWVVATAAAVVVAGGGAAGGFAIGRKRPAPEA